MRAFAPAVHERRGDAAVDALVLNAGVILADADGRTVDGFETTFAVNHLAQYLLLRLLLPALADRAIVVLTTSGTHRTQHFIIRVTAIVPPAGRKWLRVAARSEIGIRHGL